MIPIATLNDISQTISAISPQYINSGIDNIISDQFNLDIHYVKGVFSAFDSISRGAFCSIFITYNLEILMLIVMKKAISRSKNPDFALILASSLMTTASISVLFYDLGTACELGILSLIITEFFFWNDNK